MVISEGGINVRVLRGEKTLRLRKVSPNGDIEELTEGGRHETANQDDHRSA
jgi:hypothetical protein